jgi:hypothetical protein
MGTASVMSAGWCAENCSLWLVPSPAPTFAKLLVESTFMALPPEPKMLMVTSGLSGSPLGVSAVAHAVRRSGGQVAF